MSDDLQQLESWLTPLINKLSPKERRVLAREVARDLRIANRNRIKAQTNPDGTPYEPRTQLRGRSGAIRRKAMFTKLRTAKYLKIKTNVDEAAVGFMGRINRIARVHHYGLRDRVEKGGPQHQYARRELVGITATDRERIGDKVLKHIT
ncbi:MULTISPECIES: phage virion morphogenesis protein [Halomonadaceae]|uniref:phage virion morphogenesis protein n=1 Tax=Halomonadaceae TaxID=28256 RepID=UPI0012F2D377|nr:MULTISPECIES: phage virion morphogenesis protein [Halomonas]CAD5269968.1 Phage virion morphogenesis protein [Halomonas sp. 156]CAD5280723.1 Phage virion morphogenesis protein [Halomonas sp. 113]CAD5282206.1 Phage virion morphogenesis protein [Halomonas sp. 59]CAD5288321.1 Phage virion morphogenesis protein [Halomonas sp. I3]VXB13535.1 Phage virion morphogenesis protein [Halomonas titanicae]